MDNATPQTAEEIEEATPAATRPGDEHAYEDGWYQVLKQRGDGSGDEA